MPRVRRFRYEYGFAGHVTVRDPEHTDLYWTNPFAMDFGRVRTSDLLLVDHDGKVLEGRWAVNRAGFVLHAAIHEANPHIVASCHAHTTNGMAWAALGRKLDPITQTAASFHNDHALIAEEAGAVVVQRSAGASVAAAFGENKIAIHQNHGLFSAGRDSVDEAAWWFIAAERACEIQLKAEATGHPLQHIGAEAVAHSSTHLGTPFIAWLHFQPIYDAICRSDRTCSTDPFLFLTTPTETFFHVQHLQAHRRAGGDAGLDPDHRPRRLARRQTH